LSGIGITGSAITRSPGPTLTIIPITPVATRVTPIIPIPTVTRPIAAGPGRVSDTEAFSIRHLRSHTNTKRRRDLHTNMRHRCDLDTTMTDRRDPHTTTKGRRGRPQAYPVLITTPAMANNKAGDYGVVVGGRNRSSTGLPVLSFDLIKSGVRPPSSIDEVDAQGGFPNPSLLPIHLCPANIM